MGSVTKLVLLWMCPFVTWLVSTFRSNKPPLSSRNNNFRIPCKWGGGGSIFFRSNKPELPSCPIPQDRSNFFIYWRQLLWNKNTRNRRSTGRYLLGIIGYNSTRACSNKFSKHVCQYEWKCWMLQAKADGYMLELCLPDTGFKFGRVIESCFMPGLNKSR